MVKDWHKVTLPFPHTLKNLGSVADPRQHEASFPLSLYFFIIRPPLFHTNTKFKARCWGEREVPSFAPAARWQGNTTGWVKSTLLDSFFP